MALGGQHRRHRPQIPADRTTESALQEIHHKHCLLDLLVPMLDGDLLSIKASQSLEGVVGGEVLSRDGRDDLHERTAGHVHADWHVLAHMPVEEWPRSDFLSFDHGEPAGSRDLNWMEKGTVKVGFRFSPRAVEGLKRIAVFEVRLSTVFCLKSVIYPLKNCIVIEPLKQFYPFLRKFFFLS